MEISPRRLVRKDEVVEGIREIPASAGMTFEKDNLNGSSMPACRMAVKILCRFFEAKIGTNSRLHDQKHFLI